MERNRTFWVQHLLKVLILIIMEDTHGGLTLLSMIILNLVLILIIMEDTHGEDYEILYAFFVGLS